MSNRIGQGKIMLFLTLLLLLSIAACGPNPVTPQPSTGGDTPVGIGTTPEPGTNGKPHIPPEGHGESILVANGITYFGPDNGRVYALGSQDGKLHWQRKLRATSLYAVAGGAIYATDGRSLTGNTVYALNAANGELLWQHPIEQIIDGVQVVDGIVYITTGNAASPAVVYALQATNGTQLWHYVDNGPILLDVSNGRVYTTLMRYITCCPTNTPQPIVVLDASSGRVLWRFTARPEESLMKGGITEANGIVYLSMTQGAVYALQAATGQPIWSAHQSVANPVGVLAFNSATPVISNGVVYTGSTTRVFAYQASDGKQLWQYNAHSLGGPPFIIQPFVDNGVVYFVDSPPVGTLVALRASDGSLIWQHPGLAISPESLALVDGLLINQIGDVTAWRTSDGSHVWDHTSDNGVGPPGPGSSVVIGEGVIYVGGQNGIVQAFRVSDGTLLWHYQIPEIPVQEPPTYTAAVTFTPSTSYEQALQLVTDLGLQTFNPCSPSWQPQGDRNGSFQSHTLLVNSTVIGAPLWVSRLKASSNVDSLVGNPVFHCPLERPGKIPFLPPDKAGTYVQVTFSDTVKNYDTVLDAINNLGFRLANPCYEQARARGAKPMWSSVGQEGSFGKTHTLLLATTRGNSVQWMEQLQSVSGVLKVEAPFVVTC